MKKILQPSIDGCTFNENYVHANIIMIDIRSFNHMPHVMFTINSNKYI